MGIEILESARYTSACPSIPNEMVIDSCLLLHNFVQRFGRVHVIVKNSTAKVIET